MKRGRKQNLSLDQKNKQRETIKLIQKKTTNPNSIWITDLCFSTHSVSESFISFGFSLEPALCISSDSLKKICRVRSA